MNFYHYVLYAACIMLFAFNANAVEKYEYIYVNEDNLYPEGITLDNERNLYISSFTKGKIVKINIDSKEQSDFIQPGQHGMMSSIGLFVDKQDNTLWACSSDPGISEFKGKGTVSLKHFELKTQKLIKSYDLPQGGFCNDITKDNQGNIYITDSWNPRILTLAKGEKSLSVWTKNKIFAGNGFNLNGIDFDGYESLYVNKYNTGQFFKINLLNKKIVEINLPRPLFAPDGLKILDKNKILIAEGGINRNDPNLARAGTGRITLVTISEAGTANLETIAAGLDLPTTFVLEGNKKALWVVESQYDHLFKYKRNPHYPFRITKIDLN